MKKILALLAVCFVAAGFQPAVRADDEERPVATYLSLGASYAFGYTGGALAPSNGDQGYVRPYADWLAKQNDDDERPQVINLALPGETLATFFNGGNPVPFVNLNYAGPAGLGSLYTSQKNRLLARIAQERQAGRSIDRITLEFGGNELLSLITPQLIVADPATQQYVLGQALAAVQGGYTQLLVLLRAQAPEADLFLLGYPNPRPTSDPLYGLFDLAITSLNQVIAGQAAGFNTVYQTDRARYVDLYTPFRGRAAKLISADGIHPNTRGYDVIAKQITARDRLKDDDDD